jgi:hypothetical protein
MHANPEGHGFSFKLSTVLTSQCFGKLTQTNFLTSGARAELFKDFQS